MSVDLTTTYLGLKLKNPLVIGACPLTEQLETLQRLEAAGAAAAVLPSLFEEQIDHDQIEMARVQDFHTESFAESLTYFPEQDDYHAGPEGYLEHIAKAKRAVKIPIIASLNGTSVGGWTRYAKMMQDAGADALELNIYFIAADVETTAEEVEARYLELVAAVKQSVSIPLAVKVGPYFSAMANMARRLADAGADGLVLFNRFLQPDIDLETMETTPRLVLSTPSELLVPLRWIAILHGRVDASLALTGGLHDADGDAQGPVGRGRRGHGLLDALRRGRQADRQHPDRARAVDGREGVRLGRAAQGEHEPGELPRPGRLRARQLHEGLDFLHREVHLTG